MYNRVQEVLERSSNCQWPMKVHLEWSWPFEHVGCSLEQTWLFGTIFFDLHQPTPIYIVTCHSITDVHSRYVAELGTLTFTLREPCCVSAVASGFILCESVLWGGFWLWLLCRLQTRTRTLPESPEAWVLKPICWSRGGRGGKPRLDTMCWEPLDWLRFHGSRLLGSPEQTYPFRFVADLFPLNP